MKKTDPILTLELFSSTKTHITNADINRFISELKRQVAKRDLVVEVRVAD